MLAQLAPNVILSAIHHHAESLARSIAGGCGAAKATQCYFSRIPSIIVFAVLFSLQQSKTDVCAVSTIVDPLEFDLPSAMITSTTFKKEVDW